MSWQDYIPQVIVPNLPHREDRRNRMIGLLYEYGIEAIIWEAIKHDRGELGLMLTMKEIFNWCLESGLERVLILEDDCEMLVNPHEFHNQLDKCIDDLRAINWNLFYLGVNIPHRQSYSVEYLNWVTPDLLRVQMGYSTHAVLWSSDAMKFFVSSSIDQPIDNFMVSQYQIKGGCYCSYPMLCSQVDGFSDIGGQFTSWKKDLEQSFDKHIHQILNKRFL